MKLNDKWLSTISSGSFEVDFPTEYGHLKQPHYSHILPAAGESNQIIKQLFEDEQPKKQIIRPKISIETFQFEQPKEKFNETQ